MNYGRLLVLGALTALIWACSAAAPSSSDPKPPPDGGVSTANCGSPNRTGTTTCPGAWTCPAGQYCTDPRDTGAGCVAGCASDVNCGPSEYCARCGSATIGTCTSCSGSAPSCGCTPNGVWDGECTMHFGAPMQGMLCPQGVSPPDPTCKNEVAMQWCCPTNQGATCTRNNSQDQFCPGNKAYKCPTNVDPPATQQCTNNAVLGIWCCQT
jgi:hypothetical protein